MGIINTHQPTLPPLEIDEESDDSDNQMTTDAALDSIPSSSSLKLKDILNIEKQLDTYEIVSLVFLLYDEPLLALQELQLLLNGSQKSLIYNWAVCESRQEKNWQRKLLEALTIIQNYEFLKPFGFNRVGLKTFFLPHQYVTSLYVNKMRKALYCICEKLTKELSDRLLKQIEEDFRRKGFPFKRYDAQYMEMYLLHWEIVGYIKSSDFSNIKRIFKSQDCEAICEIIDSISNENPVNQETTAHGDIYNDSDMPHSSQTEMISINRSPEISIPNNLIKRNNADTYVMDPGKPGICLIINQKRFYPEFEEKYKDDFPDERNIKLEEREGTDVDKKRLLKTFSAFGFKVIVEEDLTHFEMVQKIIETVKAVENESSLFVCILSHGDRDIVYGVNTCKVRVSKIQEIMLKANKTYLDNKPKVLILQSCQGNECQKLDESDEDDDYCTTDGNSGAKKKSPKTLDLLTFWATVPGYAAIRNKLSGTWFIQTLCNKMKDKWMDSHFYDICTATILEVSNKKWTQMNKECVMTPITHSTFTKSLFLPPLRNVKN